MKDNLRWLLLFIAVLALCSCRQHNRLEVKQIVPPDYPLDARFHSIQGSVKVDVAIGADGRVIEAQGSGVDALLVQASEQNARQWVFGPFPPGFEFPVYHTITYVYRLEGKTSFVVMRARTKTDLPDRVELIATPLASDNRAVPVKPTADSEK